MKSLHIEVPSLISVLDVKGVIKSSDQTPDMSYDLLSKYQRNGISFDDFCTLYSEIKYGQLQSKWSGPVSSGVNFILRQLSWIGCEIRPYALHVQLFDVFLSFLSSNVVTSPGSTS